MGDMGIPVTVVGARLSQEWGFQQSLCLRSSKGEQEARLWQGRLWTVRGRECPKDYPCPGKAERNKRAREDQTQV